MTELKPYDVVVYGHETTLLLSDEDARAHGLEVKSDKAASAPAAKAEPKKAPAKKAPARKRAPAKKATKPANKASQPDADKAGAAAPKADA